MNEFTLVDVIVKREYTVSDVEPVRDSVGCPIQPETATVRFSARRASGLRPQWVSVKGRRTRGKKTVGHYSEAGFSIREDGSVEPDMRHGEAPPWVADLVWRAIEEQTLAVLS